MNEIELNDSINFSLCILCQNKSGKLVTPGLKSFEKFKNMIEDTDKYKKKMLSPKLT